MRTPFQNATYAVMFFAFSWVQVCSRGIADPAVTTG
jgi:hypothetical protein